MLLFSRAPLIGRNIPFNLTQLTIHKKDDDEWCHFGYFSDLSRTYRVWSALQSLKWNSDRGQVALWKLHLSTSPASNRNMTQNIMQPVLSDWHAFFAATTTAALISNSNRFPRQWQGIQLLPLEPCGKISLMCPKKVITIPVKQPLSARWALLNRM